MKLDSGQFKAELRKVSDQLEKTGRKWQKVGGALTAVGGTLTKAVTIPIAAAGAAAFKFSSDFETSLTKMRTLVGLSASDVQKFRADILNLSGETARAPRELADAMFFITSAGLRGKDALDALKSSAQASALGLGETKIVADAVTSAMNAYGPANLSAAEATNTLALAVRAGKLEASELAPTMGRLLPIASSMGIAFEDVAGVMAVVSRTGLDAAEGATAVRQVMATLLKPTTQAQDALAAVGLSAGELRDVAAQPGGLIEVMRLLQDRLGGNQDAMATIIPNIRALSGVMNVLAQDSSVVDDVMSQVSSGLDVLGEGMQIVSETQGFTFQQFLAQLQSTLISLGDRLAPAFKSILDAGTVVLDWVGSAIELFGKLDEPLQVVIIGMGALAAGIGPVLLIAGTLITAVGTVSSAFATMAGSAAAATTGLAAEGAAASTAAAANSVLAGKLSLVGKGFGSAAAAMVGWQLGTWINENVIGANAFADAVDSLAEKITGLEFPKLTVATKEQVEQWQKSSVAVRMLTDMWRNANTESTLALDLVKQGIVEGKNYSEILGDLAAASNAGTEESQMLKDMLLRVSDQMNAASREAAELAEAQRKAQEATGKYKEAFDALFDTGPSKRQLLKDLGVQIDDLNRSLWGFVTVADVVKESTNEMFTEFEDLSGVVTEFVVGPPAKVPELIDSMDRAMERYGVRLPDINRTLDELNMLWESGQVPARQMNDIVNRQRAEFERLGVLTPEVAAELDRLSAETKIAADGFIGFFSTITTGNSTIDKFLGKLKGWLGIAGKIVGVLNGLTGGTSNFLSSLSGFLGGQSGAGGGPLASLSNLIPGLGGLLGGSGAPGIAGGIFGGGAGGAGIFGAIPGLGGLFGGGGAAAGGAAGGAAAGGAGLSGLFSSLGGLFTNPLTGIFAGGALGAFGLFKLLTKTREEARSERQTDIFGPFRVPKEVLDSLTQLSIKATESGRDLPDTIASIVGFDDVIKAVGIQTMPQFMMAMNKGDEAVQRLKEGLITGSEAAEFFGRDSLTIMREAAEKLGGSAQAEFQNMINKAVQAGIEIPAEFVSAAQQVTDAVSTSATAVQKNYEDAMKAVEKAAVNLKDAVGTEQEGIAAKALESAQSTAEFWMLEMDKVKGAVSNTADDVAQRMAMAAETMRETFGNTEIEIPVRFDTEGLAGLNLKQGAGSIDIEGFQTQPGQMRIVPGPPNQGRLAIVHGQERIGRPASSGAGDIVVNVYVDETGRELMATKVVKMSPAVLRRLGIG